MDEADGQQSVYVENFPQLSVYKRRSLKRPSSGAGAEYPMKLIKEQRADTPELAERTQDELDEHSLLASLSDMSDDIYIDTADLCARIAYELKSHCIPQSVFAEKILCRSQGTLSDLLRNPRPWHELKSGRETFRRMFKWLQQPLHVRLSILDLYNGPQVSSARTPEGGSRNMGSSTNRSSGNTDKTTPPPSAKKTRFIFNDIQKRTLQAIFNETQRPSREMQETIARHLGLDVTTVANFFQNARRRCRKPDPSISFCNSATM